MSRLLRVSSLVVIAAACSSFVVAAPVPKPGAAPEWPQFRGPKRDGISPDKNLLKEWPADGPKQVWKSEPIGIGFSSVSIAGDRIFTMGDEKDSSYVYALDRNTGKRLWATKVGKPGGSYAGTRCTPTVDGNRLYAVGQFGDLVCLEAASGKELWRKDFTKDFKGSSGGWNYTESPLIDGDKLVCTPGGGKAGAIVALNKKSGDMIWESDFGEKAGYASLVVAEVGGVRQYVQLLSQGVAAVSATDGKLLWRYGKEAKHFANNTANIPNPVVMGDEIFVSAGYGRGGGLIKITGDGSSFKAEEVYFDKQLNNRHGGVVIVGDYAYGDTDNSGRLWCVEWKTGKLKWKKSEQTKGSGAATIVYADGRLYVRYDNGYVALVEASPDGYKEKGLFKILNSTSQSWAHPVVSGGKLYLREKDTLWCYDVSAK
jgi:outer membrane protein assembly factor BamB